jgi:hypothetical protein
VKVALEQLLSWARMVAGRRNKKMNSLLNAVGMVGR